MRGQIKPIYREGTLRGCPTRMHAACLNTHRLWRKSTKEVPLQKLRPGKKQTVPVMVGNISEEKPPYQLTPRRAALASTRKNMQDTQAMVLPMQKHAWCMPPGTLQQSEKYSRNTQRSTPHSGPTRKPALAETKFMVITSSLTARTER